MDPWKGLVPYLFARLTKLVDAIYISLDHDRVYFLLLLSALLAARNAGKGKILYKFQVGTIQKVTSFLVVKKP